MHNDVLHFNMMNKQLSIRFV